MLCTVRVLCLLIGSGAIVALVAAVLPGADEEITAASIALAAVRWDVRVADPGSGVVHVRAEIPAAFTSELDRLQLEFIDARRHPGAVKSITAHAQNMPLPIERPAEGGEHRLALELHGRRGPVVLDYVVDPTFYPPGSVRDDPADARSRVTPELAVVRSTSLFPRLEPTGFPAIVTFILPTGWTAVTPWAVQADTFLLAPNELSNVEYLGLGPFEVAVLRAGDLSLRLASPQEETGLSLAAVEAILQTQLDLIGAPPPQGDGVRSAIVVPNGFMRGGAAGQRSVVQSPSPEVLAHEMLHWWTHSDLVRPEAKWFQEGFTNYYGIKVAQRSGLWTEQQVNGCLADLNGEMRYLERRGTSSLAAVSRDYRRDTRARRLVYSKGALLGYLLDRELEGNGRSLDEAMRAVLAEQRSGLTNDDLLRIFSRLYDGLVDPILETHVTHETPLPPLELGAATGRSGCARYLPEG